MHYHWLKPAYKVLLLCGLLAAIDGGILPAFAQSRRYNPSPNGSPPIARGMGGTRSGSCSSATNTTFTALAPISRVEQTAASHPTFVLYVPEGEPLTIDFRLYRYSADGEIQTPAVYRTEINSISGIMPIALPETEPGLVVGEHYQWQAALICNPARRSEDLIVRAEFQTVSDTVPEAQRWYDLLETALDYADSNPRSINELLTELAALERSASEEFQRAADAVSGSDRIDLLERSETALDQSLQLTQIAEAR